jgi:CysZ protein
MSNHPVLEGLGYLPRALALLKANPELWRYVAAPLALNVLVGGALSVVLVWQGWHLVDWLMGNLPAWLLLLGVILRAFLVVLVLCGVALLVGRVGVVLGAPFYGALSERIERMLLPAGESPPEDRGVGAFVGDIARALLYELK